MQQKIVISSYLLSWKKRVFDLLFGSVFLLLALPVMSLISLFVLVTEGWPILFIQDRVGKDGQVFKMYKFRTMRRGAEEERSKYQNLNEADGPVFKIRNDPRFVGVGKWLSHIGLDELPQLINVLRGEMSLVGPRPLPVEEDERLLVEVRGWRSIAKPGVVSMWILRGSHSLSFEQWMNIDLEYNKYSSLMLDTNTVLMVVWNQLKKVATSEISRTYI